MEFSPGKAEKVLISVEGKIETSILLSVNLHCVLKVTKSVYGNIAV